MKIILAKSAGFCFGVKRATTMAFDAAGKCSRICSLGPIIHSPQLVRKLEEEGVEVVRRVEDVPGGAVIIRSHGVTADELEELRRRDLEIVDATCPFVKKAQEFARKLSREGYVVVLVGEAEHPEVQGIVSYASGGEVFTVADRAEAEALPRKKRIGVVAQTTQSFENLQQIVGVCLEKSLELRVYNTICDATSVRQNEAREIAAKSDLMLVIGGFNSANTSRLAQICKEILPATHHIETASQIDPGWFHNVQTVGITAGASTPRWIIEEVLERVGTVGK
ncbi:4-hydroxy-3-methylbut-2-enyl diphosphate reductase [Desulfuromonas versatilis]|uniref:4-hydroxy-3-methylbut-2-enyl diphosphate reductase n=1 Tax=Desulfuromonas versatilis TaxID=2802975 RepID=A0ABN6DZK2_9BACT|nr:4-hydroxy-3-methylbut-2-enyl diphosphate reductase [Desulfuromonas versatilis]BCR05421.1 4-hydroxy-3-methylbut-2-enyl diphosphate reductase [Desulfuromonas versatilis]